MLVKLQQKSSVDMVFIHIMSVHQNKTGVKMKVPIEELFGFNPVADIYEFHLRFGLEYIGPPRFLPDELGEFRTKFMQEELNEYKDAKTLEKKLDALVDLMYVLLGTAHMHGFIHFEEAWNRVQAANMKKVRVKNLADSTRNSPFDVVKPPGWVPPDLSDLV